MQDVCVIQMVVYLIVAFCCLCDPRTESIYRAYWALVIVGFGEEQMCIVLRFMRRDYRNV
ncbi:unnamed protein product [Ilex paraguariensis]|uniref:Uncharacterized protein n=1 Tax=Ilex paraguariensis TaxID=185542 RepID=A0ABC8RK95_9AQUA